MQLPYGFGEGNIAEFVGSPHFTFQINDVHYAESKQSEICQRFSYSPKACDREFAKNFPPPNIRAIQYYISI